MKNLALPRIQKMKPYSPPLAERHAYKGMLLDFNERTLPPDSEVVSKIKIAADQDLQIYPEYDELENLVADYAGVKKTQVMLSSGSDQAIEVIFRTFTENSDKVIAPAPSFDMYFQNAAVLGNELISPLFDKTDMSFPLEEVLAEIDETTKLVIVCHPNSPTGTLAPNDYIEKIAAKAEDSIVLVDEAYYEFSGLTAAGLIEKYPNIIVTRTFSKAFGLASLRVGYVIAHELYISEMKKVRSPYPVNMAAVEAAAAALANPQYMKAYVTEVMQQAKPLVEKFFADNNIDFYPSKANFILFKPEKPKQVYERLWKHGMLLRPQNKPNIEGTLRVSIGTVEQMRRFCQTYAQEILG